MIAIYCALCHPPEPEKIRHPKKRESKTIFGSGSISQERTYSIGYVVVSAKRNHPTFNRLDEETRSVHILGHPFLWLLKIIAEKAKNVREIEIIPRLMPRINPAHKEFCASRGIRIVAGHAAPEMAWEDGRILRSKGFPLQQKFMKSLAGEQKDLLDELTNFGFEAAEVALAYFGLEEDEELTQQELADKFGFSSNRSVSNNIQAVLLYLDPTYSTGLTVKGYTEAIRKRVIRIRNRFSKREERQKMEMEAAKRLGLPRIPEKLPLARFENFEALIKAQKDGSLEELKRIRPKFYEALMLRFGLNDLKNPVYRTLKSVGDILGGISRERVRQLEEGAFRFLGLENLA